MCPSGSRLPGQTAAVLLWLCVGPSPSAALCPPCCLCASDIVSCSGRNLSAPPADLPAYATRLDLGHNALAALAAGWASPPFDRLSTLVLGRNAIRRIEEGAFAATPRLLHLDLSSNRLTALNASTFAGLSELRELLLFDNRIARIQPGAVGDLRSLKRLYLSGNRLTAFPLGLYEEPGGPHSLEFLDLSFNRLSEVSAQNLLSLTQHTGIYLQENPLVCDCGVVALLEFWTWKQYRPLLDFRGDFPCTDDARSNCSGQVGSDVPLQVQTYHAEVGKWLRVACVGLADPSPPGPVFWVTPRTVVNSTADDPGDRLVVLANGTLEIRGVSLDDSGTYACVAARGRHYSPYEPLEVAVVVRNSSAASAGGLGNRGGGAEHFNTAFTTLASCVVSIVLVLLYLYLTPCRCRDGRGGAAAGCGGRAFVLCADPREVESGQRRPNGKRVAFLEPRAEDPNVDAPKTPVMSLSHVTTEGILKNGSRTVGQSLTDDAQVV